MNEIRGFRGEYQFLSNFYPSRIVFGDLIFDNVEAAFQAAKCQNYTDRLMFQGLTGAEAKKLGRRVNLRSDWEQAKIPIMTELVRQKFGGDPALLDKLIATGDAILVEENMWHDNFYGDCVCTRCRRIPGQNKLGLILMEVRRQIQTA